MTEWMENALANYRALVEKVDGMCRKIQGAHADDIACRRGCDSCCRHLSLFPVEAVALRLSLERMNDPALQSRIRRHASLASGDGCPLLDHGTCLMYDHRPLICRTHGMPLLVEKDGKAAVDYCPMNFRAVSSLEREMIIDLEQLNRTLVLINRVFVEQVFETGGLLDRLPMSQALAMEFEEIDPEEGR